ELSRDRDPVEQFQERMQLERQHLDLGRAPLMRLTIAHHPGSPAWSALLQLHHLVCDHESLETMFAEVKSCLDGRDSELPKPMRYRNHVAQALTYARTHDSAAFFRRKLGDVNEPTAPFGLLDVHGDGSQVDQFDLTLPSTLTHRLRTLARRMGMSAATLFHAAWGVVVSRTSGREDVVFGTVLLGRMHGQAGAQRVLGMFMNTLPLRLNLRGVTSKELVEQTHRELADLLSHEQDSLAVAQRCSQMIGATPLFSSLLNYRHSSFDISSDFGHSSGLQFRAVRSRTNYPVMLSVDDYGQEFGLVMNTDRRVGPERMMGYLLEVLTALVQDLEDRQFTPALMLPVLPGDEQERALKALNATSVAYAKERVIQELFEAQASSTPEAVAVMHEGRALRYADLNARANQLARYLVHLGVGPEQVVGICINRDIEMVVGLLGILTAGAAYVPLDPNYPRERLQHMLEDAAPQVVLTTAELQNVLPPTGAQIIAVDAKLQEIRAQQDENLRAAQLGLSSQDLVYVIYTSGSTGKPKGTAMSHRSMVNLIEWHRSTFGEGAGKRVLQFAALSFDVAFQEIFTSLCTGATLVLLDEWVRRDARAL